MSLVIRPAVQADAAGINAIYNPLIRDSAATFETAPHSEAERAGWIEAINANPRCAVHVAEDAGAIAGYANAAPFE